VSERPSKTDSCECIEFVEDADDAFDDDDDALEKVVNSISFSSSAEEEEDSFNPFVEPSTPSDNKNTARRSKDWFRGGEAEEARLKRRLCVVVPFSLRACISELEK
jgi:hypothetical protein